MEEIKLSELIHELILLQESVADHINPTVKIYDVNIGNYVSIEKIDLDVDLNVNIEINKETILLTPFEEPIEYSSGFPTLGLEWKIDKMK